MRKITVEVVRVVKGIPVGPVETRELSFVEFLRAGDSFRICSEAHRWPPLATFNAFLQCGVDDAGDQSLEWQRFEVGGEEYAATRAVVDPLGQVDALGTHDGDWRNWFAATVAMLRPN